MTRAPIPRFERYRELVDDWSAFVDACRAPLPAALWTNTLRTDAETLRIDLERDGVELAPVPWLTNAFRVRSGRPGKTLAFVTGRCHLQEEVSMLPIPLLDPRPGERVLDLCAAPGNKTLQAAVRMEDRGTLVAVDISVQRLGRAVRHLERMTLASVASLVADGANLPTTLGHFDRVVVDVPCSCEGTSRKHPGLLDRPAAEHARYRGRQRALLRKAVQLTRPGGRLVYSTCTYAPEENEEIVAAALTEAAGELRVVPLEPASLRAAPGLDRWQGRDLPIELRGALRVWPHHNDTGGFFVALLEKADR